MIRFSLQSIMIKFRMLKEIKFYYFIIKENFQVIRDKIFQFSFDVF